MVLAELRKAVARRMVADVPVGVLLSGGVDSSMIVGLLAESGPARPDDLLGRLRGSAWRTRRRIRLFRPDRRPFRHRPSQDLRALRTADRRAARRHRGDVGADGLLRQCRLLSALAGGVEAHQGGAVGQGADEVFGGYHWYPPLLDSDRPTHRLRPRLLRPRLRPPEASISRPNWHTERDEAAAFIAEHFADARRGDARRQGAPARRRRSCWSTIR